MIWRVLIGIFLFLGLVVGLISLYKASVAGLMQQVGLIGSDFSVGVVKEKIGQFAAFTQGKIACDLPTRMRGAVRYILSSDEEQGILAFTLGEARIKCGAVMMAGGDVEVGTYEIIKGIGYLTQGYTFVQERVVVDRRVCQSLPTTNLDVTVKQILDATSGRVYDIIWQDWNELVALSTPIETECLDQSMYVR